MNITYDRECKHTYLVAEDLQKPDNYQLPMLEHNRIPGLLPVQTRWRAGGRSLYYEITSCQTLAHMYENEKIGSDTLFILLHSLENVLASLSKYLLDESSLRLTPDLIYLSPETRRPLFLYVPGEQGGCRDLRLFAEFILKKLDHSDRAAVDLGYALYSRTAAPLSSVEECLLAAKKDAEKNQAAESGRTDSDRADSRRSGSNRADSNRSASGQTDSKKTAKDRPKPPQKRRRRTAAGQKKILWAALLIAGGLVIYSLILFVFRLDLTQAGGLAFLLIAVVWLILSGRKEKEKSPLWDRVPKEWDDEDALDELLDGLKEQDLRVQNAGPQAAKGHGPQAAGGESGAKTRYLTEGEDLLKLISTEPERYPDLMIREKEMTLGKKESGADIHLTSDAVSRMHACFKKGEAGWQLTDLNSMNGTFVNDDRLSPGETRKIDSGDRVQIADLLFRVSC